MEDLLDVAKDGEFIWTPLSVPQTDLTDPGVFSAKLLSTLWIFLNTTSSELELASRAHAICCPWARTVIASASLTGLFRTLAYIW